jgi:hypothetical protein
MQDGMKGRHKGTEDILHIKNKYAYERCKTGSDESDKDSQLLKTPRQLSHCAQSCLSNCISTICVAIRIFLIVCNPFRPTKRVQQQRYQQHYQQEPSHLWARASQLQTRN